MGLKKGVHIECEQGSEEWKNARKGIITASSFDDLITPTRRIANNKTVEAHALRVAAERVYNTLIVEDLEWNADVRRGHEQEDEAASALAFSLDITLERRGIYRFPLGDNEIIGASPDRIVTDETALIEIKCPRPSGQLRRLESGFGLEYYWQCVGQMLCTGTQHALRVSYCRGLPLVVDTVERKVEDITLLMEALFAFYLKVGEKITLLQQEKSFKIIS